jgi:hypothetical protein
LTALVKPTAPAATRKAIRLSAEELLFRFMVVCIAGLIEAILLYEKHLHRVYFASLRVHFATRPHHQDDQFSKFRFEPIVKRHPATSRDAA